VFAVLAVRKVVVPSDNIFIARAVYKLHPENPFELQK
jgi:hypothetical protein